MWQALRTEWFGPETAAGGRATEGPPWSQVAKLLTGKIPSHHFESVKEIVLTGAEPIFAGPKKGYAAKPYGGMEQVLKAVVKDFAQLLVAKRGVLFDLRDKEVKAALVKAGYRIAPLVAAHKKEAHGLLAVDEEGDWKWRICNDCTHADHPRSANSGLDSKQHSTQKTTSPAQVAFKVLKEERKHPSSPIRMVKDDIQKAFNLIALALKSIGLFATCAEDLALVNFNLIFGSEVSPGDWEVVGDTVIKTLNMMPRRQCKSDMIPGAKEQPPQLKPSESTPLGEQLLNEMVEPALVRHRAAAKRKPGPDASLEDGEISFETLDLEVEGVDEWLNLVGESHPEMARFVDDLLSIIAMAGNRCQDHLTRLRRLIVEFLGPHAQNLLKQGVEGMPQALKHTFGPITDCVGRYQMMPWSKICKLTLLAKDFANGDQLELTIGLAQELRGILGSCESCYPGFARMLIPRLDAMASHAARQFPDHKCPPREFCADPSLKGEGDRCRARERQRRTWNLFLRLARLDQGALLKVSLEAALPVPIRLSFPGKERPEDVVHFVMDARKVDAADRTPNRKGRRGSRFEPAP